MSKGDSMSFSNQGEKIPNLFKDYRESGDTILRQCQLVQLHLLYVVDRVCKQHNIRYCLAYGSLLGAMRHKGFIPWDDDLDIWMPRKDYKKFLQIASQKLPADVMLHIPKLTPKISNPFAKLRDKYSYFCEPTQGMTVQDPSGIFLDIFPLEKSPGLPLCVTRFFLRCVSSPWNRKRWFLNRAARGLMSALINVPLAALCQVMYVLVKSTWVTLTMFSSDKYWCTMPEVGEVGIFRKDELFPFGSHLFEDGTFPVPANPDAVLKTCYGAWQQIPPECKRPRHAAIIDVFHPAQAYNSMEYPKQRMT